MAGRPTPSTVAVRVTAKQPPTVAGLPVLLGVQCRQEVEQVVTTTGADERFNLEVGVVVAQDGRDFRGPYVHGRKGDRFLYLSWGVADEAGEFHMFARAKLKLNDVPEELFELALAQEATLQCEMEATNDKHEPASGSIRPPEVAWSVAS